MIYLHKRLRHLESDGLVLDQEYQRFEYETKTLEGPRARKVVPDLILHRRRDANGNVLVIEVKTARGEGERLHDFAKLAVLTGCAKYAEDYEGSLRLHGTQLPGEQTCQGRFSLPAAMAPYKHGLWLLVPPDGIDPEYWWWSNGTFLDKESSDAGSARGG
jgi:hypothetical protein